MSASKIVPAAPAGDSVAEERGAAAFRERAEVRDVLAWMRLLADPHDAAAVVRALSRPALGRAAGWLVLGFECGFPVALASPTGCVVWLAFGAGFHVVNAIVFGLDRFLWAWLAAYPALVWLVGQLHAHARRA